MDKMTIVQTLRILFNCNFPDVFIPCGLLYKSLLKIVPQGKIMNPYILRT